jgi:hypothetical protein
VLPDGLFSNQKNPNLGKFWRALGRKMFIYFMAIWNILRTFVIFYDHLVHFSGFGIMYHEKSGNPAFDSLYSAKNYSAKYKVCIQRISASSIDTYQGDQIG